ncbi:MAG: mechanosensitive ion channel family protein [Elusimicrobiaceae bacterium]|nr:mechanosensitive ion channel family protein [Elusimicrobiaceae bacterium]
MQILTYFQNLSSATRITIGILLLILLIFIFKYISTFLEYIFSKCLQMKKVSNKSWLSLGVKHKFFSAFIFAFFIASLAGLPADILGQTYEKLATVIKRVLAAFSTVTIMIAISALLDIIVDKYQRSIKLPVKGIVQAVKIIIWLIMLILILSILLDREPLYFLGGLTALSAVILLVFKDAILGLVSGLQLSMNDLVRVGDWISIPGQEADGTVIDILLSTIRIQNWDNTIVNIPAYNLVSSSFINWRGMQDSGGRRIKRAINIDVKTIRFLNDEDIDKLSHLNLLKNYLARKKEKMAALNENADEYNRHRLSNIGTFRAYCYEYLKNNPHISNKFTCMVRQLAPTAEGVPLEIYAFSNDTNWENYEGIQADIFDHFLSIIGLFDLKVYQRISDMN